MPWDLVISWKSGDFENAILIKNAEKQNTEIRKRIVLEQKGLSEEFCFKRKAGFKKMAAEMSDF